MKFILLGFALFFALAFTIPAYSQESSDIKIISFEEFEQMTAEESDKLRIYNFWATWCAPCVREMPYFEQAKQANPEVKLFFISLDDGRKHERVNNFIEKRDIQAPVYLLDDVDYNKWINKVDSTWSGAIPATLFIKANGERHFHEGELEKSELQSLIKQLKQ
ncbi:TlpA family protein disulfide reductase [Echinicola jeungdonensis]|uniref:TlpA family protein disulfide reductase n=1 Tax=Echinicola jeungdonensis TaxID=709343 RepID=A0ABV5J769_9BACT|nr:TlpA family protein disulfide reductase [Echinicola jeungdonensis]MDN3669182.1 TlpA family protein disulfide reductase [Echinicola jeungdonensis]